MSSWRSLPILLPATASTPRPALAVLAVAAQVMQPAFRLVVVLLFTLGAGTALQAQSSAVAERRALTFLDMQEMRSAGSATPSPDGRWMLYTVSTPDWQKARQQTDIHLVSMRDGLASSRQMTFTTEKNEGSPRWSRDGTFFVFSSNRDASSEEAGQSQLFAMRPDGGEARRITNAKGGVSDHAFSRDGQWLIFRAGKSDEQQLFRLPAADIASGNAEAEQITQQAAGVDQWEIAPDSRRIYFVAPDSLDTDEKLRQEKRFTVEVYNMETPLRSLWAVTLEGLAVTRLTRDSTITVSGITISDDSRWVGFRGTSAARYERNITEQGLHTELYLLDALSGAVERLTHTTEVNKGGPSFSPDGRWIAFTGPEDMSRYNMGNRRVYIRAVDEQDGDFRMLDGSFDGDLGVDFWSRDGSTIYFNAGIRANRNLMALDIRGNSVRQVTNEAAALNVMRDEDSGALLMVYSDANTPSTMFTVASLESIADRTAWRQLTDVNPQVRDFALGNQREITWRSTDGKEVGGVLVLPVDYVEGQRYPLIVAIHGGPASADLNSFNGGYGSQVYAGAGYAVLRPNYRGSTNYGESHKTDIVGNYFPQGYDDIMTGVDYLIERGIVDGDRMGALGWSAGGHWSNWILVNTDRFKAISSGAGTSNWISMYAQSDVQRNRQFYLGDQLPYHDFDAYWEQSPLKYIENAKTPTMIHVVKGDPRVPSPQSVELHMALKKLQVPTELFMYPGNSHGIPDPRNRLVKSVSEMAWMDFHVRGIGRKFAWRDVLNTLESEVEPRVTEDAGSGAGDSDGSNF